MLDILACPIDKHYPLELFELNTRFEEGSGKDTSIIEGILFVQMSSFLSYCGRNPDNVAGRIARKAIGNRFFTEVEKQNS